MADFGIPSDAAREAARRPSGQFGIQPRAEGAVSLDAEPATDSTLLPGNPTTATAVRDLIWWEATRIGAASHKAQGRSQRPHEPDDPFAAAHARARADVLTEVAVLATSDYEPDYEVSSPFRRAVREVRPSRTASVPLPSRYYADAHPEQHAVSSERAAAIRDFCFEQAARFASETWGAPAPTDRDQHAYMDDWEWQTVQEGRSYAVGLAESYAHWALVFHTAADSEPEDHSRLLRALHDRQMPNRPGWTPRDQVRDHADSWAAATGLGPDVSPAWSA